MIPCHSLSKRVPTAPKSVDVFYDAKGRQGKDFSRAIRRGSRPIHSRTSIGLIEERCILRRPAHQAHSRRMMRQVRTDQLDLVKHLRARLVRIGLVGSRVGLTDAVRMPRQSDLAC